MMAATPMGNNCHFLASNIKRKCSTLLQNFSCFFYCGNQCVDFFDRVIDTERQSGGRIDAKALMQRLRAMVSCAQRETLLSENIGVGVVGAGVGGTAEQTQC